MSNANGKEGREADAIYQDNRLVARVVDPQIDIEAKNVQFGELFQSDTLMLPDECEFQKYKIFTPLEKFQKKRFLRFNNYI